MKTLANLDPKHYKLWIGGARSDLDTSWGSVYVIFIGRFSFGGQCKDCTEENHYDIYQFDSAKGLIKIGEGRSEYDDNFTRTSYTLNGMGYEVQGIELSSLFQRIGLKPEFKK